MATFRSSGDLTADRRYEYARAALEDCDGVAAADLFRQTLELVPDWPPAHFGLGEALAIEGDGEGAAAAFARTLELAPEDGLGAKVRLARLGAIAPDDAMTQGYVAALFDEYAERFDSHLIGQLAYRGPEVIMQALRDVCSPGNRGLHFDSAIDLGCGTGLMAEAIRGSVGAIDGVDLSSAMIAEARKRSLYRELIVGDAVEALSSPSPHMRGEGRGEGPGELARAHPAPHPNPLPVKNGEREYTLLLAADVLVYIGDLAPLFAAAARAMSPLALFAFTVQALDGEGFVLGDDLRFHHSLPYVTAAARAAGLTVRRAAPCVTRKDAGEPVKGFVVVLERHLA